MMTSSGRGCTTWPGSTRASPESRASIFCTAVRPPATRSAPATAAPGFLLAVDERAQRVHGARLGMLVVQNPRGARRLGIAVADRRRQCAKLADAFRRPPWNRQRRRPEEAQAHGELLEIRDQHGVARAAAERLEHAALRGADPRAVLGAQRGIHAFDGLLEALDLRRRPVPGKALGDQRLEREAHLPELEENR